MSCSDSIVKSTQTRYRFINKIVKFYVAYKYLCICLTHKNTRKKENKSVILEIFYLIYMYKLYT